MWVWGVEGCGSPAITHERVALPGICTVLFLLPVIKEWKMTGGCCDCVVRSPTRSCRRHLCVAGKVDLGGRGGGLVSSLIAKLSTMIKDVSGYIVVRGVWLCLVVDRKGWWNLRVA